MPMAETLFGPLVTVASPAVCFHLGLVLGANVGYHAGFGVGLSMALAVAFGMVFAAIVVYFHWDFWSVEAAQ